MAKVTFVAEELGREVEAPSGYYVPVEEVFLDYEGRKLLYVLGSACIEASCCGIGSWGYARVEGFVDDESYALYERGADRLPVDTVESQEDKKAIGEILLEKYPTVRVEFR